MGPEGCAERIENILVLRLQTLLVSLICVYSLPSSILMFQCFHKCVSEYVGKYLYAQPKSIGMCLLARSVYKDERRKQRIISSLSISLPVHSFAVEF